MHNEYCRCSLLIPDWGTLLLRLLVWFVPKAEASGIAAHTESRDQT